MSQYGRELHITAPGHTDGSAGTVELGSLEPGSRGRVRQLGGTPVLRRRLMDLGVVPGEIVVLEKIAPLGDPIEIELKGYRLSLRKTEAAAILVEVLR